MNLIINGDAKTVTDDLLTIADILKLCQVENPDMVSVQKNGAFVDRKFFSSAVVQDKDEIDFLYFMGGGQ